MQCPNNQTKLCGVKSVLGGKRTPELELQIVLAGSTLVDRYGNVAKTIKRTDLKY